ncbi:hypothetical protein WDH52_02700 [Streptomyces sp. TRM70308]|uniref:hypothetical protein n=1 Tax=Streptomyces sp. TRM70308 TaxID=3131932 RepID=UPI003CFC7756
MRVSKIATLLILACFSLSTGCTSMSAENPTIETRAQSEVNAEIKGVSSQVLDLIALQGDVSEPGPGVGKCSEGDLNTHYVMRHTWSFWGPNKATLEKALERLKRDLPDAGWEVKKYGPRDNPNKTLTLIADQPEMKYGANIEFWKERKSDGKPMLLVMIVSACYRVPPGETVERY